MVMDTAKMTELFQSGRIRHQVWTTQAVKYGRLCLPSILDMEALTLTENQYVPPSSFDALIKCIAQHSTGSLASLHVEQDDLSPLLSGLAAAPWPRLQAIDTLQLTMLPSQHFICNEHAKFFRDIVKIPGKSLIVSCHTTQEDYSIILASIREGLNDLRAANLCLPRVIFRKVNIPNHETVLKQFALQVKTTNVVTDLQLHPYRQSHPDYRRYTDCRVRANFFEALIVLLKSTRLQVLEISHIEASPDLRMNAALHVWDDLRTALQENVSLRSLTMASTRGLRKMWQQSIFPALTVNHTLQSLDFAYVNTTAVTQAFLEYLPHMKGLRHVHAPGRQTFGEMWLDHVENDKHEPLDLTVKFSLGSFSHHKAGNAFGKLESLLIRNRYFVQARGFIATGNVENEKYDKRTCFNDNLVDALTTFAKQDAGLSAVYHVLRNRLDLFASNKQIAYSVGTKVQGK